MFLEKRTTDCRQPYLFVPEEGFEPSRCHLLRMVIYLFVHSGEYGITEFYCALMPQTRNRTP